MRKVLWRKRTGIYKREWDNTLASHRKAMCKWRPEIWGAREGWCQAWEGGPRDEGFKVGKEDGAFEGLKDSYWTVDNGHI